MTAFVKSLVLNVHPDNLVDSLGPLAHRLIAFHRQLLRLLIVARLLNIFARLSLVNG